jgi:hypothetical protein
LQHNQFKAAGEYRRSMLNKHSVGIHVFDRFLLRRFFENIQGCSSSHFRKKGRYEGCNTPKKRGTFNFWEILKNRELAFLSK